MTIKGTSLEWVDGLKLRFEPTSDTECKIWDGGTIVRRGLMVGGDIVWGDGESWKRESTHTVKVQEDEGVAKLTVGMTFVVIKKLELGKIHVPVDTTGYIRDLYDGTKQIGVIFDGTVPKTTLFVNRTSMHKLKLDGKFRKGNTDPTTESNPSCIVGERVEGQFQGKWFGGKVTSVLANGRYDVSWDDGTKTPGFGQYPGNIRKQELLTSAELTSDELTSNIPDELLSAKLTDLDVAEPMSIGWMVDPPFLKSSTDDTPTTGQTGSTLYVD